MRFKFAILASLMLLLLMAGCTHEENKTAEVSTMAMMGRYSNLQNLWETAEMIRSGEIDVGNEYGMEIGKRWHNIHAEVLGLRCRYCHIPSYASDYLYQRKYKVPVRGAPGVVDRGICLGCHKQNGPARELYMNAGVGGVLNP